MSKVITWQASDGCELTLTRRQGRMLERAHMWPVTPRGADYSTVSYGLHTGDPRYSDDEIRAYIDAGRMVVPVEDH